MVAQTTDAQIIAFWHATARIQKFETTSSRPLQLSGCDSVETEGYPPAGLRRGGKKAKKERLSAGVAVPNEVEGGGIRKKKKKGRIIGSVP